MVRMTKSLLKLLIIVGTTMVGRISCIDNNAEVARVANIRNVGVGRLLQEPTLPPFDPINECLGLGPACEKGIYVECTIGGVVGCMCAFIHACQPDVAGCYLKDDHSSTYCGF